MQVTEGDALLLTKIGFTPAQAQLFLTMHTTGEFEARTIARKANFPRQEVYRVLDELQEKGLIEKIISTPQTYRPIPLQDALAVIVSAKAEEYKFVKEKTEEFLAKFTKKNTNKNPEERYIISSIDGRKAIVLKNLKAHSNAKKTVDCSTTYERFTQIGCETTDAIKRALDRGVTYRTILDKNNSMRFVKQMSTIINNKNFKVRLAIKPLKINVTVFDKKEATLNFYPSRNIDESPILWTNHPSLLSSFQARFDKDWAIAGKANSNGSKIEL